MAYWNHFALVKYKPIPFSSVKIGGQFRNTLFDPKTKRRRKDIICIKTGINSYIEAKSKKIHTSFSDNFDVNHITELRMPPIKNGLPYRRCDFCKTEYYSNERCPECFH